MPNIKSAKKRVLVIEKKTAENKAVKTKIATFTKKFKAAIASGDVNASEAAYRDLVSLMQCAAGDNVIHKNKASRKEAHYAKLLDNLKKSAK